MAITKRDLSVCGVAFYFVEMAIIKSTISPRNKIAVYLLFIFSFSLRFIAIFLYFIRMLSINLYRSTWHVLITLHFYVFNLICQLFHRNQCNTYIDICHSFLFHLRYDTVLLLQFDLFLLFAIASMPIVNFT